MKRRIISGSTRAPADWNVPTRSVPASPARSACEVGLGGLEPGDDRLGVAEQQLRRPRSARRRAARPGRSTSCSPTIRSSVAICWLTADCV